MRDFSYERTTPLSTKSRDDSFDSFRITSYESFGAYYHSREYLDRIRRVILLVLSFSKVTCFRDPQWLFYRIYDTKMSGHSISDM